MRYIANRSSGRQGHAIAAALAALGARVTLVSGPVRCRRSARRDACTHVETAQQMLAACQAALPADVAVFAAAVADWRVAQRRRRQDQEGAGRARRRRWSWCPIPTSSPPSPQPGPRRPRLVIGFAAETDDLMANAQAKRARKNADWIVANDVSPETGIMGGEENAVHLITADGVEDWPRLAKQDVARRLAARIATALR